MNAVETLVKRKWTGKTHHIYTYRFVNQVPIRDGEDALAVNRCELTVTSASGKRLYKNAFRDRGGKTLVPVNFVAWIQITRECLFCRFPYAYLRMSSDEFFMFFQKTP